MVQFIPMVNSIPMVSWRRGVLVRKALALGEGLMRVAVTVTVTVTAGVRGRTARTVNSCEDEG